MIKKCFTVETRLNINQFDVRYFIQDMAKQNMVFRIVWKLIQTDKRSQSKLNTYLQQTFQMDKRTANTIIQGAKGRLKALKELKQLEKANLTSKIITKRKQIEALTQKVEQLKVKVVANAVTEEELEIYRKDKRSLWCKKQKLNRMQQALAGYERLEKAPCMKLCWGTKRLFKAQHYLVENGFNSHVSWLNTYRKKRDSQVNFIGSADEPCGNQNAQLSYDEAKGLFSLRIRKDLEYMQNAKDKFMAIEGLDFNLHKNELIGAIREKATPLTLRILRRENKWYLQVIFTWKIDTKNRATTSQYGTLGLDFNDGFITLSETDYYGNLVGQHHYPLHYHGTGDKAKTEIQTVVASIVKLAQQERKSLVIENLDFGKTKARTDKGSSRKGKAYNKMIHALDYSRYKKCMENACHRHNVELILINPAYTSMIGVEKYSRRMKLSPHQAASYVIARKGQGYIDKLMQTPKRKRLALAA